MSDNYIKNITKTLTPKQKSVIDLALDGHNIALTGFAGTGKSYCLDVLFKALEHKGIAYGKTSSTGVSAMNIGGSTLHSFCGIGLGDLSKELLLENLKKYKKARSRIKNCEVLVIDEISMIKASLLDKLDYIFRKVRRNDAPFGNVQIILSFDFLQLPPVIRSEEKDGMAFESKVWDKLDLKTIYLKEIIRQKDKDFANLLSNLRVGKTQGIELLDECVGREIEGDIRPIKIYMKNYHVNMENSRRLNEIDEKLVTFRSIDMGKDHHIKYFDKNCPAPKKLELKVGAQVMLLKNIDIEGGLFNGAMGIVSNIGIVGVTVRFASGEEIIERDKWEIREESFEYGVRKSKVIARRSQIPLKLAFATSAHKNQGATLDCAHVDISEAFEDGQAYVALSRVRDLKSLILEPFCVSKVTVNQKALDFYQNLEEDEIYENYENEDGWS